MTIKTAIVSFQNAIQHYSFLYDQEEPLKRGDIVVVDSAGRPTIGTVYDVFDKPHPTATKYVIQKVDMEAHQERLQRAADLKMKQAELDKRVKAFQQNQLIELLKQQDPEAACLIREIERLKGNY